MTESQKLTTNVLIIGLGPVGATLAHFLGRDGISTIVIDRAPDIFMNPRAIALDNEALRILQNCGLKPGSVEFFPIQYVQMRSPIFGTFARSDMNTKINGHPKLVTFYQPQLERELRNQLTQYPSVQVLLEQTLETFELRNQMVHSNIRSKEGQTIHIESNVLIGADGANSLVRQTLGIPYNGKTFEQDWLIVDAKDAETTIQHVDFYCDPRRPTPHMRAPGQRLRWEFMLQPGETREQMERPDTVQALLKRWGYQKKSEIERIAVYRFHARIAEQFSKGPVHLVGDAAHITPPFAGQGLVAGLRDAMNLGWKLSWAIQNQNQDKVLLSYHKERHPHAWNVIRMAVYLGALIMPNNWFFAALNHGFVWLANKIPGFRTIIRDLKIKPAPHFKYGFFDSVKTQSKLKPGYLFPQGLLIDSHGNERLSDDVLGYQFCVVCFDRHTNSVSANKLNVLPLKMPIVDIQTESRETLQQVSWISKDAAFRPLKGYTVVVRPDKTIFCMDRNQDRAIERALKLLGRT